MVLQVEIPDDYPFSHPRIRMLTPAYHPTIKANGRVVVMRFSIGPDHTEESAEVVDYSRYWTPAHSFMDVAELVYRQLNRSPAHPLFSQVCGYKVGEWTGQTMLSRITTEYGEGALLLATLPSGYQARWLHKK